MSLLSSPRLEAVRLIREQLRCTLCHRIFRDPQCLDCKHNFCRDCILLHMRRKDSQCPQCQLPTQPNEVTRNQFLESILAAWNSVEKELQSLQRDPGTLTAEDTDRALGRAAAGAGDVEQHESHSEERQSARGRVANHKWHINTQEIRQELRLEQPYLPQHYGHSQGSNHVKTSSSDLPDDYGGGEEEESDGQGQRQEKDSSEEMSVSLDVASEGTGRLDRDESAGEFLTQSATQNGLMATQEVESYLERINKQREALSQWERSRHQEPMGLAEILGTQRRDSENQEDEADLLTQMPMSASVLESPDLLASFHMSSRRRNSQLENHDAESDSDSRRRPGSKVKRQVQLSSPPPLYPRTFISSPSRKRLRVPSLQNKEGVANGQSKPSTICATQIESDDGDDEVPDSQPNAILSGDDEVPDSQPNAILSDDEVPDSQPNAMLSGNEEVSESGDDPDDSDYEVPDSQPATRLNGGQKDSDDEEEKEEEEYEMKPAVPLPPTDDHNGLQTQHCERLRDLFSRNKDRISDDFRSAITAFQAEENHTAKSLAARQLSSAAHQVNHEGRAIKVSDATGASPFRSLSKPPIHTANGSASDSSFVFVSSDLAREEIKRVMEACQRFGGKFGQDFDLRRDPASGNFYTSVTHLITKTAQHIDADADTNPDDLRCKRTAKYMRALAEGTFVMDISWVIASLTAGRWLTEEPFEMVGDIYSDSVGKPREARIRRKQTGRRNSIFKMFCFVLLVSESEFDFQFASVRALVNNFGGRVMHSDEFEKLGSKQRARRTPIGVVSKITTPYDAKDKWQQYKIPIVRITWIFDSVSHLEVLPFDDYYPY